MKSLILVLITLLGISSFAEYNCYKITEITVHAHGVQIKGPNVAQGKSGLVLNEKLGDSTYRRNLEAAKFALVNNLKFCLTENNNETITLKK